MVPPTKTDIPTDADSNTDLARPFTAISVTRSYEQVVRQIEAAIRSGQLARGQRLPTERELAGTFDVSRGVVREAIRVLSAMGLVESRQGSGLYVRNAPIESVTRAFVLSVSPNAESVERLFEFRTGLERESATHAAVRRTEDDLALIGAAVQRTAESLDPLDWTKFGLADNDFHQAVAQASGNPYLVVAITTAREMQRDVVSFFAKHAGRIETAIRHHQAIFEAIRDGQSVTASNLMAEHIRYTMHAVQTNLPLPAGPSDPLSNTDSSRGY